MVDRLDLVVLLGLAWALGGALVSTPVARIAVAIMLLPILMVPAAWYGGWWLIPADLAWLAIEVGGLRPDRAHAATGASNGMS